MKEARGQTKDREEKDLQKGRRERREDTTFLGHVVRELRWNKFTITQ